MSASAVAVPLPVHRWWIDALLIASGAGAIAAGWYVSGGVVLAVGLSFPIVHLMGVRGQTATRALQFVPDELAERHHRIRLAAATLPGTSAIERADDVVLEAAAIFAGRPVRGATHRRYVRQRSALLDGILTDLTERASALLAARAEVEGLDVHDADQANVVPETSDPLATLLLWLLAPLFIAWEVGLGAVRAVIALIDGVALRLRTVAALLVRGLATAGRAVMASARRWRDIRLRFVASWREARRQFASARFRLLLRLRRAGRAA